MESSLHKGRQLMHALNICKDASTLLTMKRRRVEATGTCHFVL